MSKATLTVTLVACSLAAGCSREGVEPPALRVTRFAATWPCPTGGSGRHDLTLNKVEVSGEPTMYDLVITCAPGDSANAVTVERGRWGVVGDSTVVSSAGILELYSGDGVLLSRYRRGGTDSLAPLHPDGTPQDVVLHRVDEQP